MKNLPLILASFILVLLFACGSDTATNQTPGTGEEVIFSMDSFAINLTGGTIAIDTSIEINVPNIKLTFDCSTNADSISSTCFYRISAIDSTSIYIDTINNSISYLNKSQQLKISGSLDYQLVLHTQITQTSNLPVYIRMKNIKAIKMQSL